MMGRDHPNKSRRVAAAAGCVWAFLSLLFTRGVASTSISDRALEYHGSTGRTLLQAKKSCPVKFQDVNYTVITSQCLKPYTVTLCCGAFKEFACPYAELLNDLTNNCAETMFSYINMNGNYPQGLFSSLCHDSKRGLECPGGESPADQQQSNTIQNAASVAYGALPPVLLVLWFQLTFMST